MEDWCSRIRRCWKQNKFPVHVPAPAPAPAPAPDPVLAPKPISAIPTVCTSNGCRPSPPPAVVQILEEGECEWYNKFYCNGEIVEDLSSWWFEVLCEKGTMKVGKFLHLRLLIQLLLTPYFLRLRPAGCTNTLGGGSEGPTL